MRAATNSNQDNATINLLDLISDPSQLLNRFTILIF